MKEYQKPIIKIDEILIEDVILNSIIFDDGDLDFESEADETW